MCDSFKDFQVAYATQMILLRVLFASFLYGEHNSATLGMTLLPLG